MDEEEEGLSEQEIDNMVCQFGKQETIKMLKEALKYLEEKD